MRSHERVVELEALAEFVTAARARGERVAHCHGCFDVLHFGHVRHFEAAHRHAEHLVVTVTPDEFVNKGPGRPVFPAEQRAEVIAGLRSVARVAINRWPSAVETIRLVRASCFVKGDEYERDAARVNPAFLREAEAAASVGTEVVFTREAASSSTAAVTRLRSASPASDADA